MPSYPLISHPQRHVAPMCDIDNKGIFYLPSVMSIGCMYWYRSHRQGLKAPALSMLPTMQILVEDLMYVSQVEMPISGEGD